MCSLQLPSTPQSQAANNIMSPIFGSNKTLSLPSCPKINLSQSFQTKSSSPLLRLRLAEKQKCGASRNNNGKNVEVELPERLDPELMPKHVAVIMDGNRRWAKTKGLAAKLGHRAGGEAFKQLCRNCLKYGVKVVSVFAFSTENLSRNKDEVESQMNLFQELILSGLKNQARDDRMRYTFVGNREQIPKELQKLMQELEAASKGNKKLQVVVAIDYGGRYDITQAAKRIAGKVRDGVVEVEEIDDGVFEKHLETDVMEFPNPDLMIRTSGELRVSNFMLWQMAYTELFFTNKMFPDFDHTDLIQGFTAFQKRN